MKLKKFLAFSFLILLVFSMTALATAQPIDIDMEPCPATGDPHSTYLDGDDIICANCYMWLGTLGPLCPPHAFEYVGGRMLCAACGASY